MDHFIGFDQLLRLFLGRGKSLHLFGPHGFLDNVMGKLRAYTWNLVSNYQECLNIKATEIDAQTYVTRSFNCQAGFEPSPPVTMSLDSPYVHREPGFSVSTAILDHRIPSLAFALKERFHVNILKPRLEEMGLAVGPWISRFKELLVQEMDPATEIQAQPMGTGGQPVAFSLGELAQQIARITPGQKIAYVADALYSEENKKKIVDLAHKADHLFIEAAFSEKDRGVAKEKYHLTAHQAGDLARKAMVRELSIFHHSPRYLDQGDLLEREARKAFGRN